MVDIEIYRVETEGIDIINSETLDADCNDYDIMGRVWVSGDQIIRVWTADEYINCDPKSHKKIPYCVDDRNLLLDAHCVESRQVYARNKAGRRLVGFLQTVDYDKL